jgi:hypothetical protein
MLFTTCRPKSKETAAAQAFLVQVTCTRYFDRRTELAFEDGIASVGKAVGACTSIAYFWQAL